MVAPITRFPSSRKGTSVERPYTSSGSHQNLLFLFIGDCKENLSTSHIRFNGPYRAFDNEFYALPPPGEDDVALINQLRSYRLVVHAINCVVKPWIGFQVLNIFRGAG